MQLPQTQTSSRGTQLGVEQQVYHYHDYRLALKKNAENVHLQQWHVVQWHAEQ